MAGQFGGRKEKWTVSFKEVNLHPHFVMPFNVWMSKISEAVVAAAPGTDNDIELLHHIKVPLFFRKFNMSKDHQKDLLKHCRDVGFDWSPDCIKRLPKEYCETLESSSNLFNMFRYVNSLGTCIDKGLLSIDDVTPDHALLVKPGPQKLQSARKIAREAMSAQSFTSYKALGNQNDSKMERFKAACRHRSRFEGSTPSSYLDLCITPDQKKLVCEASPRDLSMGNE